MTDDPKIPERPVEAPVQEPNEIPDDGGDVDFPGGAPEEAPGDM
jgi:hypothetical protein